MRKTWKKSRLINQDGQVMDSFCFKRSFVLLLQRILIIITHSKYWETMFQKFMFTRHFAQKNVVNGKHLNC